MADTPLQTANAPARTQSDRVMIGAVRQFHILALKWGLKGLPTVLPDERASSSGVVEHSSDRDRADSSLRAVYARLATTMPSAEAAELLATPLQEYSETQTRVRVLCSAVITAALGVVELDAEEVARAQEQIIDAEEREQETPPAKKVETCAGYLAAACAVPPGDAERVVLALAHASPMLVNAMHAQVVIIRAKPERAWSMYDRYFHQNVVALVNAALPLIAEQRT